MFEKRNATEHKGTSTVVTARSPEPPTPAPKPVPQSQALVGQAIKISGEISGTDDISIDGKVEGAVKLPGNSVTIGNSGEVRADITASAVYVNGRVSGDIVGIEQVVLTASAWVQGNITAPRVILESGSKFKGSIDMEPVKEQAAQAPKTSGDQAPAQKAAPFATASATAKDAASRRAPPARRESAARP